MKRMRLLHLCGIVHCRAVHIAVADAFFSFFDLDQPYPNPVSRIQNSKLQNQNSQTQKFQGPLDFWRSTMVIYFEHK